MSTAGSDEAPRRTSPLGGVLRLGFAAARPVVNVAGRAAARGTRAAIDAALDSGLVDDALASPVVDRLTQRVVNSPGMERLVARVIDSKVVDAAVERLLDSEDLWIVVDEVARSPSVTQAISHQSIGFAGEMTDALRARSIRADERIEAAARRLLRRSPQAQPPPPVEPQPES